MIELDTEALLEMLEQREIVVASPTSIQTIVHAIITHDNQKRRLEDTILAALVSSPTHTQRVQQVVVARRHNANHPFMKLAPELRNKIYDLILPKDTVINHPESPMDLMATKPALLSTCRFIRDETLPMYFGRQCLRLPAQGNFQSISDFRQTIYWFRRAMPFMRNLAFYFWLGDYEMVTFALSGNTVYTASYNCHDMDRTADFVQEVINAVQSYMPERTLVPPEDAPILYFGGRDYHTGQPFGRLLWRTAWLVSEMQ